MKNNITVNESKYSFLEELSNCRSAIMGIAIVWIMLFHSGIEAPDNLVLRALWYIFVSFGGGVGVNIFFLLSGFGLYFSVAKYPKVKSIDWGLWAKKRVVRLLPSYLIVSIVYYLLKDDLSLYNILMLNFWIDGVRHFWFIPAIAVCYLLFPFIYLAARKWSFFKVSLILLVALSAGNFIFEACSDYYSKIEIFTWRLLCFVIGVYLGELVKNRPNWNVGILYGVTAILFAVSFVFNNLSRPTFVLGTVLFLPVLTWIVNKIEFAPPIFTTFSYFGSRSLQIYLLHVSIVPLLLKMVWQFDYVLYFAVTFMLSELLYRLTSLIKINSNNN